jgi:hypothetical protein
MQELEETIIKYRNNRVRLRSIYLNLRKLNKFEGYSDILLLNSIVEGLIELDLAYSQREVRSAFKCIDKNDYDSDTKNDLLNNLLRRATNKSIFK